MMGTDESEERRRSYGQEAPPRMPRRLTTIDLDLRALATADLGVVDALARLQLEATRHGARVRVVAASDELAAMIELAGLAEVLGLAPGQAGSRSGSPKSGK